MPITARGDLSLKIAKRRAPMDANAFLYLGRIEYEQRLREAEEARRVLRASKVQRMPPLWKTLWLLFF
jgi:hypothetical protein